MKKHILIYFAVTCTAFSCKLSSTTGNPGENDPTRTYRLRLNPPPGAKYYYTINSRSEVKFEANSKKVDNINKTTAGMNYRIDKDSAGNFEIHIQYDKLHVYTKNDDMESDMDAASAATTTEPIEKMLGTLTGIPLVASVTPAGEVRSIVGYDQIPEKILAVFPGTEENTRRLMREKIKQMIGNGIIKNNIANILSFFPDSAVHVNDKWKLNSPQISELNLNTEVFFTLVKIEDGVATIRSQGKINRDSASIDLMGFKVLANLNGGLQGEYEMDTRTGMLVSAQVNTDIGGSIDVMGQDVPLSLQSTVKIFGEKK